jgi:hypothetical protein
VRGGGKSRLSTVRGGRVGGGSALTPSFMDSSAESSGQSPTPRHASAAMMSSSSRDARRKTFSPVIELSATPMLRALSAGGDDLWCF